LERVDSYESALFFYPQGVNHGVFVPGNHAYDRRDASHGHAASAHCQRKGTPDEMLLMTSEKIDALAQAGTILIQGGKIVAANVKRLRLPE
jgi:hypothetical protein